MRTGAVGDGAVFPLVRRLLHGPLLNRRPHLHHLTGVPAAPAGVHRAPVPTRTSEEVKEEGARRKGEMEKENVTCLFYKTTILLMLKNLKVRTCPKGMAVVGSREALTDNPQERAFHCLPKARSTPRACQSARSLNTEYERELKAHADSMKNRNLLTYAKGRMNTEESGHTPVQ